MLRLANMVVLKGLRRPMSTKSIKASSERSDVSSVGIDPADRRI
jgi:hypothetical protein